ncbi:IS3 family transposase [Polynucleobacter sphagniphilus]|uniref:IS3 family transposase n=1 Tax=Polynucleobacter sphagniphilus TaxID=1743169 RepID=UPI0024063D24|nr:IS3 family transposase [Polynucleobacter sphagniphilus]
MKRTKYTAEFKLEAVKQILEKGHSATEVAGRLGVPVGLLYTWSRKLKGPDEQPIEDVKALQAEMAKLKAELRRTTEERDIPKKGRRVLCQSVRVKYAFIKEHRDEFRLSSMCRVLKVHRSGYYAWLKEPQSPRALENAKLAEQIRYYYDQSMGIYGSPRIYHDLKEAGISCSENRVARLMKASQLRSIRGYKRPRYRVGRPALVSPNQLQRQFTYDAPDQAWVTDITYIRTYEGWLYLAVVIDLHSRLVVGWSMQARMETRLVLDALTMAIWRRKPKNSVIIHSDQGSQFGSDEFNRWCKDNSLSPSMSRRGNCWDNAVAESFFSSLKSELIKKKIYPSRSVAKSEIFEYIEEFYNRVRRHKHLSQLSPFAFEQRQIAL